MSPKAMFSDGESSVASWCCVILLVAFLPSPTRASFCQKGFQFLSGKCYYFSKELYNNRDQAEAHCRQKTTGAGLVALETAEEGLLLRSYLQARGKVHLPYWIGATSRAGHSWEWPLTGEPLNYVNWCYMEPNNKNGNEFCTVIMKSNFNYCWNDVPCKLALPVPFICETDKM